MPQWYPEALKRREKQVREAKGWPWTEPEFDLYLKRARECLLWRMSPDYYDSMTEIEYIAFFEAWEQLQKEAQKG